MSFRLRLTLLAAVAVAVAVVGSSFAVYYTDRHQMIAQVDSDLSSTLSLAPLNAVVGGGATIGYENLGAGGGGGAVVQRASALLGKLPSTRAFKIALPRLSASVQVHVTPRVIRAGRATGTPHFATRTIEGVPMRVMTLVVPNAQITATRSLVEVDNNLAHLKWLLVLVSVGGVGAAALLGALVSGRAVAPLRRLTETAERIVETGDLSQRTGRSGRDEISRLSTRLDELLASLEGSLRTQRQLVADASHELRTPLATVRANIGVLANPGSLAPAERTELLADVQEELEAMTSLVGELVELARGEEPDVAPRAFRLDEVVQGAVDRAARRAPNLRFATRLEPSTVSGVPERVERAVDNLLDNARKWSPPHETVEVSVRAGHVEVRDHGPGIAAEDMPLVFNRFYRSRAARAMPGAGLGLAIVKQVAEAHGGSVTVDRAADGGAILRLELGEPVRPSGPSAWTGRDEAPGASAPGAYPSASS